MSDWLAGQAGCRCSPLAALAAGPPVFHLFPTCKVSIHQPVKGDANAAVSPIGCTFFISTTDCSTVFFCCLNGNGFGRDFTQIFFLNGISWNWIVLIFYPAFCWSGTVFLRPFLLSSLGFPQGQRWTPPLLNVFYGVGTGFQTV